MDCLWKKGVFYETFLVFCETFFAPIGYRTN